MNKALLSSILETAKAIASTVIPGVAESVKAAESMIDLIKEAKALFTGEDADALDEALVELRERVEAHAASTSDKLRG